MDASKIPGNASLEVKEQLAKVLDFNRSRLASNVGFGTSVVDRMQLTDVSINPKLEEPQKLESRVVCELTVGEDMVNTMNTIHGGCSAFLIDICSTLAFIAFGKASGGSGGPGVSQALDMVYHAPAALGDKLKVVNTTLTVGGRAMSARTEIWNTTHHRLVASGVHIKMHPSPPKAKL